MGRYNFTEEELEELRGIFNDEIAPLVFGDPKSFPPQL